MQVEHSLPGAFAVVDQQAERVAHTMFLGELARHQHQMAEQRLVFRIGIHQTWNTFLGDHQQMHRRARVNVADGDSKRGTILSDLLDAPFDPQK